MLEAGGIVNHEILVTSPKSRVLSFDFFGFGTWTWACQLLGSMSADLEWTWQSAGRWTLCGWGPGWPGGSWPPGAWTRTRTVFGMAAAEDQDRAGVLEDIVSGTSRGTSIGTVKIVNQLVNVPENKWRTVKLIPNTTSCYGIDHTLHHPSKYVCSQYFSVLNWPCCASAAFALSADSKSVRTKPSTDINITFSPKSPNKWIWKS